MRSGSGLAILGKGFGHCHLPVLLACEFASEVVDLVLVWHYRRQSLSSKQASVAVAYPIMPLRRWLPPSDWTSIDKAEHSE